MKILVADHVLPMTSEPIREGAVAFDKGEILAVGFRDEVLRKFPGAESENFGEAAILPGFVNTHSHLELSALRGFLDRYEHDFASWLLTVTITRAEKLSDDDVKLSALLGAIEGARAGVTTFADIGRHALFGCDALKRVGLRGIAFQETEFSPREETAAADFEKLRERFLALNENASENVRAGISPHAPYTVSRKLFGRIADFATSENIPITIHAAESQDETKFMLRGEGFFAEIYKKNGIDWNVPGVSSLEFLSQTGILETKPLLAHCVKVSEEDIEIIQSSDSSVAHCPKSNAKFGHGIAPLEKYLAKGIRVGFGSDSVASNNTCDLLEESRFAAMFARTRTHDAQHISAKEILRAATFGGAHALNLSHKIGSLETGKCADIAIISLRNAAQLPVHDVESALLFASGARDVVLTLVGGEEVYRNGKVLTIDEGEIRSKISELASRMS